jgi:hypothetical protein
MKALEILDIFLSKNFGNEYWLAKGKKKRIKREKRDLRLAKIHEIHKNSLFGTLPEDLGWPHDGPAPVSSQIWIVLS